MTQVPKRKTSPKTGSAHSSDSIALLLRLPRPAKRLIALVADVVICVLAVWLAFYLRLGEWRPISEGPLHPMIVSVALALPIFITFGLYRAIFRHADGDALLLLLRAVAVYTLPFAALYTLVGVPTVPRTIGLIQPILLLLLVGTSRLGTRLIFAERYTALWRAADIPRVLIYGAGRAGRELAVALRESRQMTVVGFIDDDPQLWRTMLRGVTIYSPDRLDRLVSVRSVSDIILALPSAARWRRKEILDELRLLPVHVRVLPSFADIASGAISVGDLREPDIEDLLGRNTIPPNQELLQWNISDRVVLVTGAGGSIGSELCRQILALNPSTLILFDHSEFNLYRIHEELLSRGATKEGEPVMLVPLLGSVSDRARLEEIVANWRPATILHAAAYKHVPLVEHNVIEGIRNNVLGTLVAAQLAQEYDVGSFILISTDKAVRPTNVMGATKRLSELVLQALQDCSSNTKLSMVRFGNVLGSSGSVIPLFRTQIAAGGPVTITHKDITRYFMTIPEAAQLVLQAGAMARGGDVFLLEMGEPVRIYDLARNMIELSGLTVCDDDNPNGDIEIQVRGLRPGEKLYEELLIDQTAQPSEHERIMRANEQWIPWEKLDPLLRKLLAAVEQRNAAQAREILRSIVPEFQPTDAVDLSARPSCTQAPV